ncbi:MULTISPECIES: sugar ABC transporter permease [Caloramator]|uniref:Carbohydrate ABC transporter membrane protein 2, CUT1 family (TC 3.A.1.1.-) n=1 Tax=Caloramator proteoclasticus DSM 10124 TaxID=1121262 RepID=A0A1M5ACS2_9CLOT|nr:MULTISPECIES: sugar ABC transporter permease [Caloramator]SHF27954.1 carbohydrate ABC transporter membrane protein 2, CUT1 family (TC 3.A.1.1.-) [Caloramator proteoclasticus DSM 10124]
MSTNTSTSEIKLVKKKKKLTPKTIALRALVYTFLITNTIFILFPVLWIIGSSLNPGNSLYSSTMFPKNPTFIHYKELFTKTDYPIWYKNTLKIAFLNMIFSTILTTFNAYVFSRFRFKGRKPLLVTILVLQVFPSFLTLTAVYVLLMNLGLYNTHIGLVLFYAGAQIPGNTWLIKGYFDQIPKSLDEAARVDGATNFTTFTRIIMPLAVPIIVFLALTSFIGPWMDFIFQSLILSSAEKKTLAMGLMEMVTGQSNTKFTLFAAGAILVAIPITILYAFLQKYIVEGLSSGAVKS